MYDLVTRGNRTIIRDGFSWDRKRAGRRNPLVLHGTSALFLEDISSNGLMNQVPVFREDELETIGNILGREVRKPAYCPALTTDPDVAISFAKQGPSVMASLKERITARLIQLGSHPGGIRRPSTESRILNEFMERIDSFYARHKPLVLLIESASYSVPEGSIDRFYRIFDSDARSRSEEDAWVRDRFPVFSIKSLKPWDICQMVHRDSAGEFGGQFELSHKTRVIPPEFIKAAIYLQEDTEGVKAV